MNKRNFRIVIVPAISLIWGLYAFFKISHPFYPHGIDPEYIYLFSGLNFAQLKFNWVGHTDNPGTPYQIFIAIVLRLSHLIAGRDRIAADVIQRPEFYLGAVSISIALLQTSLLLIIGRIGIKTHKTIKVLLLQLTPFFHPLLISLSARCNPDRFFISITLLFIIVLLKFAFGPSKHPFKLAVWSGIVMGLGIAVKFNYFPLLLIPIFLLNNWKLRGIYTLIVPVTFLFMVSPVIDKLDVLTNFLTGIIQHDGLYGTGQSSWLNTDSLFHNIGQITSINPQLILILSISTLAILYAVLRKVQIRKNTEMLFLMATILVALIQIIIVSRHFKNYYLTPLFTLFGLMFFALSSFPNLVNIPKKISNLWLIIPALSILVAINQIPKDVALATTKKAKHDEVISFIHSHINKEDYWLIEPTWKSGPLLENALVFGISYSRHRYVYEDELMLVNQNLLTFEGDHLPIKRWRGSDIEMDTLFNTNHKIHILSTPVRHADQLLKKIQAEAALHATVITIDTIFSQPSTDTKIIELTSNHP